MRYRRMAMAVFVLCAGACEVTITVDVDSPAPPEDLEGAYYDRGVDLYWQMGSAWDGEAFRVYGRRTTDTDYFFIAEVTSCSEGECLYRDINVRADHTYEYYVAAADPDTGEESASDYSVEVYVPYPTPPPVPDEVAAVALDNAVYLRWSENSASDEEFVAWRVYYSGDDGDQYLGDTDSPGFIDLLAENGTTATYYVTSIDYYGHESHASELVETTPRPDYTSEIMYPYQSKPEASGFRFQETDDVQAVMDGDDPDRHFSIEVDADGLWFVPGPGAFIHPTRRATSALKCGPGADPDCTSWEEAPTSGYGSSDIRLEGGYTYMFHVPGDDGEMRYGAVRTSHSGGCQEGYIIIFDWAYQTQAGNPQLSLAGGSEGL
ncbi:MAG: hypothetical protein OXL34_01000 [Gemmatimonadota bacterium]|nr:hypothetical protein [Gemmatimonadota bacterium]